MNAIRRRERSTDGKNSFIGHNRKDLNERVVKPGSTFTNNRTLKAPYSEPCVLPRVHFAHLYTLKWACSTLILSTMLPESAHSVS